MFLGADHGGLLYHECFSDDMKQFWNLSYNSENHDFEAVELSQYGDSTMDMYNKYITSMFNERQESLYKELENVYSQFLPTIPLFSISYRSVYQESLLGYLSISSDKKNIFWNVEDWRFSTEESVEKTSSDARE